MMRRALLYTAALGLTLATAVFAQEEHPPILPGTPTKTIPAPRPWLTGAELLRLLEQNDRAAVAYLKGVFDATESGLWCYTDYRRRPTPKQSAEVMQRQTVDLLHRLPPDKLKERAAVLVVRMWQDRWPCPPDGCCPGRGY
jgi:hypothetical protein